MAKHSKNGSCGYNIGQRVLGQGHDTPDDEDALHLDDIKISSYPNARDWEDDINGVPFRCAAPIPPSPHSYAEPAGQINENKPSSCRALGHQFPAPCAGIEEIGCWRKQIVLPGDARAKLIAQHLPVEMPEASDIDPVTAAKDGHRINWWRRIAGDADDGTRRLLIGTQAQISSIAALAASAPNFVDLFDIIISALRASMVTWTPLRLPPILLLGPPGVGKTFIAGQIAGILGTAMVRIDMTSSTGVNVLGGTDMAWKSPRIGRIAEALIEGETASPFIFIDEIDKAFRLPGDADPLAPLHGLLEPHTARVFRDELLEVEFAADALFWIATANAVDAIAPSLLDRMLILRISPPSREQMLAVLSSIYRDAISHFGIWFNDALPAEAAENLLDEHPRRARRLLDLACAIAAADSRRAPSAADISRAKQQLKQTRDQNRIGFLR